MATLSDYRTMLLTHLETNDPATLRALRQAGAEELEAFLELQLDAVRNLRATRPARNSESPSQRAIRTEIERAALLEYQPARQSLEDPSEMTAQERALLG